jgi:DNA-3-methyladenine glycosylase I
MKKRCRWAGTDADYIAYHDLEWGVPVHDDRTLFEFLILEGAQAGLSWLTILKKRDHYRRVFDGFSPEKIARYDQKRIDRLLADPGIIRNRLKVNATITNARAFLAVRQEFGSFDKYLWRFVDGRPVTNAWKTETEMPAQTDTSRKLSRDLKKRGFTFVGPVICYSFMQAVGMVNDHVSDCFRHHEVQWQSEVTV